MLLFAHPIPPVAIWEQKEEEKAHLLSGAARGGRMCSEPFVLLSVPKSLPVEFHVTQCNHKVSNFSKQLMIFLCHIPESCLSILGMFVRKSADISVSAVLIYLFTVLCDISV